MSYEKSCGAVVYRRYHGNIEVLLIKHINSGHWSFPKGHVEKNETEIETAMREVKEETNIEVRVDPTFREVVSYYPKQDIYKEVVYFIAGALNTDSVPQKDEVAEVRWVDVNIAGSVLTYDNDRRIINKAKEIIKRDAVL